MRWGRFRKWAKWGCTVAAGVAVGLAAFSRFYWFRYATMSSDARVWFTGGLGVGVFYFSKDSAAWPSGLRPEVGWFVERRRDWYWGFAGEAAGYGKGPRWRAGLGLGHDSTSLYLGVSVLYPVLVTTVPAALLWYADRRRFGAGGCPKCGYDRRGLGADATCPECGTTPV